LEEPRGCEVVYRYNVAAGAHWLVDADGKPLDRDPDELERQMQAEFERQESGGRVRRVDKVRGRKV